MPAAGNGSGEHSCSKLTMEIAMNANELAAVKVGDVLGIARYIGFAQHLSYYKDTVSKITMTQIVMTGGKRFSRVSGDEITSQKHSKTSLMILAKIESYEAERKRQHNRKMLIRTLCQESTWASATDEQLERLYDLVKSFKKGE